MERFNNTFKENVLNAYVFNNTEEVSCIKEIFRED
ncbi:hypothetical protein [Maribacter sp. 2-571]